MRTFMDEAEEQVRNAGGENGSAGADGGKQVFVFRSAAELCASRRRSEWLIRPILDEKKLAMIFGEATGMKSFLAIDTGLCIATKQSWHHHQVGRQGPVFYICGEGFAGRNARIKAWSQHHKVDLADVPFFVSERPAQFLDHKGSVEVHAAVDELHNIHGQPALIIVDTLNRNFGPGDENSTQDMTKFVSAMDQLRIRYQCTVLIIHHSGWSASERARGASALRAALDWEYKMTKNADGTRTFSCTKSKDHAEPPVLSFRPKVVSIDGWVDEDEEPVTSCVLEMLDQAIDPGKRNVLRGARRVAYEVLVSFGNESVHIDAWRNAAYRAGVSPSSSVNAKQKAFRRAVTDLLDAGLVKTENDYYRPAFTGQNRTFE